MRYMDCIIGNKNKKYSSSSDDDNCRHFKYFSRFKISFDDSQRKWEEISSDDSPVSVATTWFSMLWELTIFSHLHARTWNDWEKNISANLTSFSTQHPTSLAFSVTTHRLHAVNNAYMQKCVQTFLGYHRDVICLWRNPSTSLKLDDELIF